MQDWDEIVDLKILTARRYDLAADRTRAINRLRAQLLEYFPSLERAFDYAACRGALVLLTG
ncbi:transposase [Streptomyces flavidovirens]|uniref:IS110 family transposase n=1 Tax=Streptomyces flavidovirens TaxID=67298 RepID=UPI003419A6D8